jgi:glycosyltransferase involved in cell wall biosynthesis
VSQYPALNHTFILREIRTLRELKFDIEVVSIRAPDRPLSQLSPEEREEADRTWGVLPAGFFSLIMAQAAQLCTHPLRYLSGVWIALRLARLDLKAMLLNLVYFAEAVAAGRYLQSRGITHLHTHFSSTVALLLVEVFPITYSATIHGPEEFDNAVGFYLAQKVAAARFLCAISQYARSQLMRASRPEHWSKIEVSPLGVDPARFAPRPHRASPAIFEIVSVGRLAPAKAHAILIESIALLMKQGRSNIRLRIAGGGPEHMALKQLIAQHGVKDHVLLEGPCNQDKVRQMYRESDLFALASFAEGVPVVLMEAMSMEIPCLATWITGVPELIRHGEDGWLVPPSDPLVLADAIAHLIDHPDLRRQLGANGRLRVEERYNLRKNTELLSRIFRRRLQPLSEGREAST